MIRTIKTLQDLISTYQFCNTYDAKSKLFFAVHNKLPKLIVNLESLAYVIEKLGSHADSGFIAEQLIAQLIDLNKFKRLIKDSDDLLLLFQVLKTFKRETIVSRILVDIGLRLPQLITTMPQLMAFNNVLSAQSFNLFILVLSEKLPAISTNLADVKQILSLLGAAGQAELMKKMQQKFVDLIQTTQDFIDVLNAVKPEIKSIVIDQLKVKIKELSIIKTEAEFYSVMKVVSKVNQEKIMHLLQPHLAELLTPAASELIEDFNAIFVKRTTQPLARDYHRHLRYVMNLFPNDENLRKCFLQRFNCSYRHALIEDRQLHPFHLFSLHHNQSQFKQRAKQLDASYVVEKVLDGSESVAALDRCDFAGMFMQEIIEQVKKSQPASQPRLTG
jgi:hypothetical protein